MRYFTALDVETTGLDPTFHGMLSIGACTYDESGNPVDELYELCNPGDVVYDPRALAVNRFLLRDIHGFPLLTEAMIKLDDHVRKYDPTLVFHNAPFDFGFILPQLRKRGLGEQSFRRVLCTISLGYAVFGEVLSLEKLCGKFGLSYAGAHDARVDARLTIQCFFKLREALYGAVA